MYGPFNNFNLYCLKIVTLSRESLSKSLISCSTNLLFTRLSKAFKKSALLSWLVANMYSLRTLGSGLFWGLVVHSPSCGKKRFSTQQVSSKYHHEFNTHGEKNETPSSLNSQLNLTVELAKSSQTERQAQCKNCSCNTKIFLNIMRRYSQRT